MPTTSSERRRFLLLGSAMMAVALAIMLFFSAAKPAPVPAATPPSSSTPDVDGEGPFLPRAERFADAAGCRGWLSGAVGGATDVVAARGPYQIATGDIRAHRVRLASGGHEITEWRCLDAALSERSWVHVLESGEVAPFSMDDLNAMKF